MKKIIKPLLLSCFLTSCSVPIYKQPTAKEPQTIDLNPLAVSKDVKPETFEKDTAYVELQVSRYGNVYSSKLISSSGDIRFDKLAIEKAKEIKFKSLEPGIRPDQAFTRVIVPVSFKEKPNE